MGERGHLLGEIFFALLDGYGFDVAARRQDETVFADLLDGDALAKTRLVGVGRVGFARPAPRMISARDFGDVGVIENAKNSRFEASHAARVDEKRLLAAVGLALWPRAFVARQKPQTGGNLGVEKELRREGDHTFHAVALDQTAPDFAFAALPRTHRAVGQHHARAPGFIQVRQNVLQPREVGIALRRRAIKPADVAVELGMPPIGHVEGRVGEREIGAQIGVLVGEKRIGGDVGEVGIEAVNRHVHFRQAPRRVVRFLPVNRDIGDVTAPFPHSGLVTFDEFDGLNKHSATPAARVVDAAMMRRQNLNQNAHHAFGRVELAALLAFRERELAEKVFVDLAQKVAGLLAVAKTHLRDQIDQFAELVGRQLGAREAFVEQTFKLGVSDLDGFERLVNQNAKVGLTRGGLEQVETGFKRHPENAFGGVIVALFEFGLAFALVFEKPFGVGIGEIENELLAASLEGIGNVFDENEAENEMFIFGGVEIDAEFIGGLPENALVGLGKHELGNGG